MRKICYIHGPQIGLSIMALSACVMEFLCGYLLGFGSFFGLVAWHAAVFFFGVAAFGFLAVYSSELRSRERYGVAREVW
jgi:hypothetical protein